MVLSSVIRAPMCWTLHRIRVICYRGGLSGLRWQINRYLLCRIRTYRQYTQYLPVPCGCWHGDQLIENDIYLVVAGIFDRCGWKRRVLVVHMSTRFCVVLIAINNTASNLIDSLNNYSSKKRKFVGNIENNLIYRLRFTKMLLYWNYRARVIPKR